MAKDEPEARQKADTRAMSDVERIVHVSTYVGRPCPECDFFLEFKRFVESVTHMIDVHDYVLLHVGQQTETGPEGQPWQSTVAVLGRRRERPTGGRMMRANWA